jgi:hypothetical protein
MSFLLKSLGLLPLLFVTVYSGILTYGCNQGSENTDIENAIDDVVSVATGGFQSTPWKAT